MNIIHERRPTPEVDRLRCDACGSWNDPQTRDSGGRYSVLTEDVGDAGGVLKNVDGPQGCWFCGCPDLFSGGSLGDMTR